MLIAIVFLILLVKFASSYAVYVSGNAGGERGAKTQHFYTIDNIMLSNDNKRLSFGVGR